LRRVAPRCCPHPSACPQRRCPLGVAGSGLVSAARKREDPHASYAVTRHALALSSFPL
jgi:hypothetical protein